MGNLLDNRNDMELITLINEIEDRKNRERQANRRVFWTGFTAGVVGTAGSLFLYNRYRNHKNQ